MKPLRIFLVNVGFRNHRYPLATPPMGVMYIASYLRSKFNTEIRLINQRLDNIPNDELVRQIIAFNPDVVGLGTITPMSHHMRYISQALRKALPDLLLVLGGPHISSFGLPALEGSGADAAVPGEGELAMEAIINAHFEGDGLAHVPGIFRCDETGEAVQNPGCVPLEQEIDRLPFPAYDLIDVTKYWTHQSMAPIPRRNYISLFSSRGCPYGCKWCHNIFGKKFRPHSAERIVAEIEQYQKAYGVKDVEFLDDIFNHSKKRVLQFTDLLHQKNLKTGIVFPNAVRGDALNEEVIDAMVSAGMYFSSFALESGSPRLQQTMGKLLDIPRFLKNIEYAVKKGVFTNGFMMIGFPTETAKEMQETIDVAANSKLHTASFFTVTPFPNTELYDMVKRVQPEVLKKISYNDTDYCSFRVNISAESDQTLFQYQRKANRSFFLKPSRILRIARDYPQRGRLLLYTPILLHRLTKGFTISEGE